MIREYTLAAICGVVLAVLLELLVLRTGLFRDPRYWIALAVVACFQLLVNGVLTCPPIVSYDPAEILGPRIACAPIEDLAFGFAMVTTTIALWRRTATGRSSQLVCPQIGDQVLCRSWGRTRLLIMDELQSHLRREPPPGDDVVLVRGGEDTVEQLRRHAERINRADVLEGSPLYGLSVSCLPSVESADLDRLLACFDPASHNPGYGRFQR